MAAGESTVEQRIMILCDIRCNCSDHFTSAFVNRCTYIQTASAVRCIVLWNLPKHF